LFACFVTLLWQFFAHALGEMSVSPLLHI
jgi:hypothetical protein